MKEKRNIINGTNKDFIAELITQDECTILKTLNSKINIIKSGLLRNNVMNSLFMCFYYVLVNVTIIIFVKVIT